jgi:hypothetical protein
MTVTVNLHNARKGRPNGALLPMLQITCDMDKGIMLFLIQMAAPKFHFKKSITNHT